MDPSRARPYARESGEKGFGRAEVRRAPEDMVKNNLHPHLPGYDTTPFDLPDLP
jgi:hypothetical protein